MKEFDPLVNEAVASIKIIHGPGHPHPLSLNRKVKLLLIEQLVGESNRMFANILAIFSMLSGMDISYKTVERLYSDEEVIMAIHNLHVLILKGKDITRSDATGDGFGYSLTVKKKCESHAQKLKDMAKDNPDHGKDAKKSKIHRKRLFTYSFAIMDLQSRLYIAFGSSIKSEREAYDMAMKLLSSIDVEMDSIRHDRYYSSLSYMDKLDETKVFVISKKNTTLSGSQKWKDTMKEFVPDTMNYLEKYHQRSNSESVFAADKKMPGWNAAQRRNDRIDNAQICTGVWHNMFNMRNSQNSV